MSASVSSLIITPISDSNNRIEIVDNSENMQNETLFFAALPPMQFERSGVFKPQIIHLGTQHIDVILLGENDFKSQKVSVSAISTMIPFDGKKYLKTTYAANVPPRNYSYLIPWVDQYSEVPKSTDNVKYEIINETSEGKEIVDVGQFSGVGSEYVSFNSSDSVRLPSLAQSASASEVSVVDDNNEPLLVEINVDVGTVKPYKLVDGSKVFVKGYGSCLIGYNYTANRFKITYDAKEFRVTLTNGFITNNAKSISHKYFKIDVGINKLKRCAIYDLTREIEVAQTVERGYQSPSVDRNLTEKSRTEIEKTVTDDNSGAELKLKVIDNVTLTDGLGNEWGLKFGNPL